MNDGIAELCVNIMRVASGISNVSDTPVSCVAIFSSSKITPISLDPG